MQALDIFWRAHNTLQFLNQFQCTNLCFSFIYHIFNANKIELDVEYSRIKDLQCYNCSNLGSSKDLINSILTDLIIWWYLTSYIYIPKESYYVIMGFRDYVITAKLILAYSFQIKKKAYECLQFEVLLQRSLKVI